MASGREVLESLAVHPDAAVRHKSGSVRAALGEVVLHGDYAQFGVYRGKTARLIAKHMIPPRHLHLFDSFEGLPEDWTHKKKAGAFKLTEDEIPDFESDAVIVHKGWFKDTVPVWAKETKTSLAFIHLDADLYSSTIDVLFNIDHLLPAGAIILFDEYIMGKTEDEHRALMDWMEKFHRKVDYLWRSAKVQVCTRVTH
jgi:hypothetical protein